MSRLVVVFGATGNVGAHVISGLVKANSAGLKIRAVTRDPDALLKILGPQENVEVVKGELSITGIEHLQPVLEGATRVFMCLPQSLSAVDMVTVSNGLVDACKKASVPHIVRISSARIDTYLGVGGGGFPTQGPLGEAHVAGETYTKQQGIGLTSVRPTSFSSNFVTYDLSSIKSTNGFASPLGTEAAVNWVAIADIAAVAVRALVDSSYDGKELQVTGPPSSTLTALQMKALIEKKSGRTIEYTHVECPPIPDLLGLWNFLRAGGFDLSTSVVLDATGKAPQDFSDFLDTLDLTPA